MLAYTSAARRASLGVGTLVVAFTMTTATGCRDAAPEDPEGPEDPEDPVELLSLSVSSVDLEYEAVTPLVQADRYWGALMVRLDNDDEVSLPLAFIYFSLETDNGLSYAAAAATEFEPEACAMDTSVLPGASASCRLLFAIGQGELPSRVVYSANDRSAEATVEICTSAAAPTLCGRRCVDLQSDPENCGGCGNALQDGLACRDGAAACPDGTFQCGDSCAPTSGTLADCDGACVDLASDPAHCGACGVALSDGEVCTDGVPTCFSTTRCGDECVNLESNLEHCGACDAACPMLTPDPELDQWCGEGSCRIRFPTPGGLCRGPCEDLGWTCESPMTAGACNCDLGTPPAAGSCDCHCTAEPV